MRHIKLFITALLFLFAFLWLITALLPSEVTVSKTVSINAKEDSVAMQLKDFNSWKNWYPLFQNKNINIAITQNNDTSFAALTNDKGKNLSIALLKSSEHIVRFYLIEDGPKEIYQFDLKSNGAGETQLTWNIYTTLGWYPWRKLSGVFMDKIKGPQYEAILDNLKKSIEEANQ